MGVTYYPIREDLARRAHDLMSFSDYQEGRATKEYRALVDLAAETAERQKKRVDSMYHAKIDGLLDLYAKKLADVINRDNEIGTRCPSVMISGGSNFPVQKKRKQNAAWDKNHEEWNNVNGILDKIKSVGKGEISADDPDALVKLRDKLKSREQLQATEERAFAEKHHAMVRQFLRVRRLPEADFYDVVIFGYLEAVRKNFRAFVEPERRNFRALASLCMASAVRHELQSRQFDIRKANYMADSLDEATTDTFRLHDVLPDDRQDVMMKVENRDLIRRALRTASERELEVLALSSSGFSMSEVSRITGLNIHTVHQASCHLHAKARPVKDGAPPGKTPQQRYYEAHKAKFAEYNKAWRQKKKAALNATDIESGPRTVTESTTSPVV